MKILELCKGTYASKWGLTDFYPEAEKTLRDAFASGEEFRATWGAKKEINYVTVERDAECISIEVTAFMDDLYDSDDLIYDALWEVAQSEEELPQDIIDSIRDAAMDGCLDSATELCDALPPDATFEQVCVKIECLENYAMTDNNSMYQRLCDIVADHVEFMKKKKEGEHETV